MADSTLPSTKTPWHLWVVGVLAVLWNSVGAMDFVMTQAKNTAYLSAMTPKQLEYIYSFPFWAVTVWGIAVWGGVLGSLLLLFRKSLAVCVFVVSLIGIVLTDLYNFVLSNGLEVMGGAKAAVFPAVIFVIGVLLWLYTRAMRTRGVLR
jgi:hypothetical protein